MTVWISAQRSRAASFSACRAAASALHTRLCPARQSACEHSVPQYRTTRQALQWEVVGAVMAGICQLSLWTG